MILLFYWRYLGEGKLIRTIREKWKKLLFIIWLFWNGGLPAGGSRMYVQDCSQEANLNSLKATRLCLYLSQNMWKAKLRSREICCEMARKGSCLPTATF